jgi:PBSX family phage terminase large subunit
MPLAIEPKEKEFKLNPNQLEAQEDWRQDFQEILYDGSGRSGKTFYICYAIIQRALYNPGSRHLIARYRERHAKTTVWDQTLIPLLYELLPENCYTTRLNPMRVEIKTPYMDKPSTIHVWGLANASEIIKIMGSEFNTIFLNEMTSLSYDVYQMLKTRISYVVPGLKNYIINDCNPLNQHHWVYKYFFLKINPENDEPLEDPDLIFRRGPWLTVDNHHLPDTVIRSYKSLTGAARQRLFEGLWVSSEGLVYPDYDKAIIEPIELKKHWKFYTGTDFGFTNPFCNYYAAEDEANETYYIFNEYYHAKKTINEHCENLIENAPIIDKRKIDIRTVTEWNVADHDAGDRAVMEDYGISTIAAKKDIISGVNVLRELLKQDRDGYKIKIFSDCRRLISEFSGYKYPEEKKGNDADEKPKKENDHSMDAIRYMAVEWNENHGGGSVVNLGNLMPK